VRLFVAFCGYEALVDLFPVDGVPPGSEVVGALVLVLEVVCVLPDVVAEDGVVALGERVVLVGGGGDLQFAAFKGEPAPAGAELLGGGLVELLLEVLEGAEVFLDLLADLACRFAAALGLHDLPEHGVVDVAAAIVLDDFANVLGDAGEVLDELLGGFLAEFCVLFYRAVEIGDVGLVVLVVVELHRGFVDERLKRRVIVGQRG